MVVVTLVLVAELAEPEVAEMLLQMELLALLIQAVALVELRLSVLQMLEPLEVLG